MKQKTFISLLCIIPLIISCNKLDKKEVMPSFTSTITPSLTARTATPSPLLEQRTAILPVLDTPTLTKTISSTSSPTPTETDPVKQMQKTEQQLSTDIDYQLIIGTDIRPMPLCCKLEGGGFFEGQEKFLIKLVRVQQNFMIWITTLESGKVEILIDILVLPALGQGEIISANYCSINGQPDPFIVTISSLDREAVNTRFISNDKIRIAWRVDSVSGKISVIPSNGIECIGGGGFDPNNVVYEVIKKTR